MHHFLIGPTIRGGVDALGVGNVVLAMGGRRTGEEGTEGFGEQRVVPVTDGFSEGILRLGRSETMRECRMRMKTRRLHLYFPHGFGDGDHVELGLGLPL